MKKTITKYLHGQSDELEDLWDYDAPQQDVAHYWLYEHAVTMEVDMDTGEAVITHLSGVPLAAPVKA
jgi:hypothetical protein